MLKIVGAMGSGSKDFGELSKAAGHTIAACGHHLLTGAGGGVMEAVARAFVDHPDRKGLSLGIVRAEKLPVLQGSSRKWQARVQNRYVEIPIKTHLPLSGTKGQDFLSRNHINVLTADAVIMLPGDEGTKTELELALQYGRPTILFLGENRLNGLSASELQDRHGQRLLVAANEEELRSHLRDTVGCVRP